MLKEIEGKEKILKNVPSLELVYSALRDFNYADEEQSLIEKLEELLGECQVIHVSGKATKKIFDLYFEGEPPFGLGKKKDQFPDAYILTTLEEWCKTNNEQMYLLTGDSDQLNFYSPFLITNNDLSSFIDKVNFTFGENNRYQKVHFGIENLSEKIIDKYIKELSQDFEHSGVDSVMGLAYEINSLRVKDMEVTRIDVIKLMNFEDKAEVTFGVREVLKLNISYEDISYAHYDREDDKWYSTEEVSVDIETESEKEFEIFVSIPSIGELTMDDIEINFDFEVEVSNLPQG